MCEWDHLRLICAFLRSDQTLPYINKPAMDSGETEERKENFFSHARRSEPVLFQHSVGDIFSLDSLLYFP